MSKLNILIDGIPAREVVERMKARGLVRFREPIVLPIRDEKTDNEFAQVLASVSPSPKPE